MNNSSSFIDSEKSDFNLFMEHVEKVLHEMDYLSPAQKESLRADMWNAF